MCGSLQTAFRFQGKSERMEEIDFGTGHCLYRTLYRKEEIISDRSFTHASCLWGLLRDIIGVWGFELRWAGHLLPTLSDAAFGGDEHIDDICRYKNHRGERHKPPDALTPGRVHILPQCQRSHFNGAECEYTKAD